MSETLNSNSTLSLHERLQNVKHNNFEKLLQEISHMNDYDYEQMFKSFEFKRNIDQMKKEKYKNMHKANKRWKGKLVEIKEKKKFDLDEQQKEKEISMAKKRQLISNLILKQKESQNSKRDKIFQKSLKEQEEVRKNIEDTMKQIEEKRLNYALEVESKLELLTFNNKQYLEEIKKKFETKNKTKEKNSKLYHDKVEQQDLQNLEDKKKEAIEKYTKWLKFMKEMEKAKKKKKQNRSDKIEKLHYNKESMYKEQDTRKKEIEQNLNDIDRRRKEAEKQKANTIRKQNEKIEQRLEKHYENKDRLLTEKYENNMKVLDRQFNAVYKATLKDSSVLLTQSTAVEKSIINHYDMQNDYQIYNKYLSSIKANAVTKFNQEERRKMYKDKKRLEEERNKKEEEAKNRN